MRKQRAKRRTKTKHSETERTDLQRMADEGGDMINALAAEGDKLLRAELADIPDLEGVEIAPEYSIISDKKL